MPWWGLLFAAALALAFNLPVSIINATTNQFRTYARITYFLPTVHGHVPLTEYSSMHWLYGVWLDRKRSLVLWGTTLLSTGSSLEGPWDLSWWLFHTAFPDQKWIPLINLPVLLGATAVMPPTTSLNFNCYLIIGFIFNYYVFKYRKGWWQRYNYVLSATLDAGLAFMGVLIYFTLTLQEISILGEEVRVSTAISLRVRLPKA
ncbi:hypothetical protein F3Y22_tig00110160pilonHSYRG00766 [Hibiscus syriacus]|uniref:Uncharacterized protein n=1 Tax=Hibiscus syriacus TaxID=106335 RepID=A0A6A3BFK2_HIBSY|nr:hypothetical protein F3Y22_tig00110160pilonHSYRG00766 [Hibiscus syriacus]